MARLFRKYHKGQLLSRNWFIRISINGRVSDIATHTPNKTKAKAMLIEREAARHKGDPFAAECKAFVQALIGHDSTFAFA